MIQLITIQCGVLTKNNLSGLTPSNEACAIGVPEQLWTLICVKLFKMAQHPMNKYNVVEDTGSCASVMNSLVSLFKTAKVTSKHILV